MKLQVGDKTSIDSPSLEQVRHYLHFMPPQAPFIILSDEADSFIQAAPQGEQYRIEYKDDEHQYATFVTVEKAAELFEAFLVGDASYRLAIRWRRLNAWNDPLNVNAYVWLILLAVVLAVGLNWYFW
jgi:hypothetical protein